MSLHPSRRTIILTLLGIALCSLFVSGFFQAKEVHRAEVRIAGKVTAVTTSTLLIIDARGSTTTIAITKETNLRDTPPSGVSVGDQVMATGEFTPDGIFTARAIRRLRQ